jgi:hypothetical protein
MDQRSSADDCGATWIGVVTLGPSRAFAAAGSQNAIGLSNFRCFTIANGLRNHLILLN